MSINISKNRIDLYPSRIEDEPLMIDRKDPVIYSEDHSNAPLTKDQIERYNQDGFLVIEHMFDGESLDLLRGELYRLKSVETYSDKDSVILEPGSNAVRSIFKVHRISPVFNRLARDKRIIEIAQFLLGSEVYLHQTRLNYKPGYFGKAFYWHSDFETWHVEDGMPRMRAVSVSISLTENTHYNGPLMLIPGSHRRYISCVGETPEAHYKESLQKQEYGVPDPESLQELADKGGIESATGPAGTVVFFECNTMHGSNSNISPLPRANAFFVYNSVHNTVEAPFGPDSARPGFLAEREDFSSLSPSDNSFSKVNS